jgi:hypothetical protein
MALALQPRFIGAFLFGTSDIMKMIFAANFPKLKKLATDEH